MARKKGGQQQGALAKQEERAIKRDIQKVKAKAEGMRKKDAWRKELHRFQDQMLTVGFTMKEMAGDGNCLFRAIGDQIENAPDKHEQYRRRIVDYLRENRENFEPFIIDMSFDEYCKRMATPGTWGGNIELQAASLALNINITVHQLDQPRWVLANFGDDHKMIHISYHDGQHYNSLYPVDKTKAKQASTVGTKSASSSSSSSSSSKHNDLVKLAMDSTGFTDRKLVEEILQDCEWELDAAIESLIAMQGTLEYDEPEVQSAPTNSTPKELVDTKVSQSAPNPEMISVYDEDAAIQASLLEYELQQNASKNERKVDIPEPTELELLLQQSVLESLSLTDDVKPKDKKKEKPNEDSGANKTAPPFAKPKQTNNKKAKPPAARKLTNRERKAQKKQAAEENKQQKKEDMDALLERIALEELQKHASSADSKPVVDLGARLI